MARKRKKKQPKFTIRQVDVDTFTKLNQSGKRIIKHRKKTYNVDVSGLIDIRKDISSFKSRKEFREWTESMSKLKNRADLQIRRTKEGTVASKKQINQSNLEVKRMIKKLTPIEGEKGKYKNKYGSMFTTEQLKEMNLQTNVARDMEINRQKYLESIPRFDKKGRQIKDLRKDKTGGTVIVREKFDPTILDNNQRIKIREYNLKKVSDPERYSQREKQLKLNFMQTLREALNEDAQEIIEYVEKMSDAQFNNFYIMFMDSSLGFEYIYQSHEHLQDEKSAEDSINGIVEGIKTDIQRYEKNKDKYRMLEKYK